jgi:general secretion pathway protein B
MSYILEALKKSQQERELGRIPTLDTNGVFVEDKQPVSQGRWALLAVALALLAVLIALWAALRGGPAPSPEPSLGEPPAASAALAEAAQPPAQPSGTVDAPPLEGAMDESGRPLVEAPPPKRTPPAPSPPAASPSAPPSPEPTQPPPKTQARVIDDLPAAPALEPGEEEVLLRQLQEEQAALSGQPPPAPDDDPPSVAVPPDLIQDIEAFKRQVRLKQTGDAGRSKPSKAQVDPTRLSLTPAQQAALPAFVMTVHVYDPDASKRFVLINGLKYREGDETRESLRIEQVLKDGAVLSHLGKRFYVPR